jgi:phosphatidylinositol-4,5-bisphosphate 3-kinase catalytic subunit alpha/beta/delta
MGFRGSPTPFLQFLKKFGIEREKAPFFFTPQFLYILGGFGSPHYKHFETLCVSAYNVVREHSDLFTNLCMLLLSVGLPELRSVQDIMYLRDHLLPNRSASEAAAHFVSLAQESLRTSRTQINDLFHMWAN